MLDADTGLARWLEPLFALFKQETQASTPGASAIFAKLADVFLTQALRSYLAAADSRPGLAQRVRTDPDIARILTLTRTRPEARGGPSGRWHMPPGCPGPHSIPGFAR